MGRRGCERLLGRSGRKELGVPGRSRRQELKFPGRVGKRAGDAYDQDILFTCMKLSKSELKDILLSSHF